VLSQVVFATKKFFIAQMTFTAWQMNAAMVAADHVFRRCALRALFAQRRLAMVLDYHPHDRNGQYQKQEFAQASTSRPVAAHFASLHHDLIAVEATLRRR
jgi:hypothetical protein